MTLSSRDGRIVQLVARFQQLSSAHIYALVFSDIQSHTPCDRSLRRLSERGYLARLERRNVGGSRGGSGQYVYQLGRLGHSLYRSGRYTPLRSINYHSLAIVDSYLHFNEAAHKNNLVIRGFSTEPDCWATIGNHELKPDMFIEIARPAVDTRTKIWLEVDMGTEGQRQIKDKLERYWHAFNEADTEQWPVFPFIWFLCVDAYRVRELRWIGEQGPKEAQQLFRFMEISELPTVLS